MNASAISLLWELVNHLITYNNVLNFVRTINDDKGMAIGARHITVSTSGLAHKIRDFANEGFRSILLFPFTHLTMSCVQASWRLTVPFRLKNSLLLLEYYIETTNRRVTFEYIMLNEVNDGVEQALELAELLKNIKKLSYVNLIPYNPVSEHDPI